MSNSDQDESSLGMANFMDVACLLAVLHEEEPEKFRKATEGLGLSLRKGYYLVQVARSFEGLQVPRERLARIGWTKLQLISPFINPSNCKKLLAMAEAHPVHALKALLDEQGLPPQTHCVLFYLSDQEFDVLAKVLKPFGASRKGKSIRGKSKALVLALTRLAEHEGLEA